MRTYTLYIYLVFETYFSPFISLLSTVFNAYTARKRELHDKHGPSGWQKHVDEVKGGANALSAEKTSTELFEDFFGVTNPVDEHAMSLLFEDEKKNRQARRTSDIAVDVSCSLEELYHGCTKKVPVDRQRLAADGQSLETETKIFTVEVHPGWRAGTKITFQGAGNHATDASPGDVICNLVEKEHPRFKRFGKHIVFTTAISLCEALTGCTVHVDTLDGRRLAIPVDEIIE
jgi:DnaJ-class molecular chaperone